VRERPPVYWTLAAITALGAALRLYHLDYQSIWHDEAISLTVSRAPLGEFFSFFKPAGSTLPFEYNPPVYGLILHVWFKVWGFGGFEARLLSAVAGILALPLIFALTRRLYDASTGLVAALLLAVSQIGVMFSQEARNYELLLLLALVTAWLYWIAMSRRSLPAWCGFTVAAVLMVLTQYYGAFVIIALAVFTVFYWRRIPLAWVAGTALTAAAALIPWAMFALGEQVSAASDRVQPSYFSIGFSTVAGTINRFNNGAVEGLLQSTPAWTFLAGGVLFGGPLLVLLARAFRTPVGRGFSHGVGVPSERQATTFVLLLFVVPLAAVLLLGAVMNVQYSIRYVAFCIAPYYVLVAAGLTRLPAVLRTVALVAIVAYSGYALSANYRVPYKENYRDAIRLVSEQAVPGDCYAFVPFGSKPLPWSFYTTLDPDRRVFLNREIGTESGCPRLWILTYERAVTPVHALWRPRLAEATAGLTRALDARFFWVRVERYDRAISK